MNPAKVTRDRLQRFTDLPNVGPALARDFVRLGFSEPARLAGADPHALYKSLCALTGTRQDPCVLDVFQSVTDFLAGAAPAPWWRYSARRKLAHRGLAATASRIA